CVHSLSHSLLAMILFHTKSSIEPYEEDLQIAGIATFTKSGTVETIPPINAARLSPDISSIKNTKRTEGFSAFDGNQQKTQSSSSSPTLVCHTCLSQQISNNCLP
ncbi:hypothetical protein WUBG_00428, partial [Wuchereria bancrofti]